MTYMQPLAAQTALALGPVQAKCNICGQMHEICSSSAHSSWANCLAVCGAHGVQYANKISNIAEMRQIIRDLINDLDSAHTCFLSAIGAELFYDDDVSSVGRSVRDAMYRFGVSSFVPILDNLRVDLESSLYGSSCEKYITDGNYNDNDFHKIYSIFHTRYLRGFQPPHWLEPWLLLVSFDNAKTVIAQRRIQLFVSYCLWEGEILNECESVISYADRLPWIAGNEHPLPPECEKDFMAYVNRIVPACRNLTAGYQMLVQTTKEVLMHE